MFFLKKINFSLLLIVIVSCITNKELTNKNKVTDLKKYNLKGQVKQITDIVIDDYRLKYSEIKSRIEFNKKGFITEKYDDLSSYNTKTIYKYDNNNNIIDKTNVTDRGSIIYKDKFNYDNKNRLIEEKTMMTITPEITTKYKYNKGGKLIQVNINGEVVFNKRKFSKKYKKGKLVEIDYKNGNFKKYTYNTNSLMTNYEYTVMGKLKEKEINSYHKNNIIKKRITYKEIENKETTNIYDDKGNIIEQYTNFNDYITKYKYQYDSFDNWVHKVTFYNGKETSFTTRIIEYYNTKKEIKKDKKTYIKSCKHYTLSPSDSLGIKQGTKKKLTEFIYNKGYLSDIIHYKYEENKVLKTSRKKVIYDNGIEKETIVYDNKNKIIYTYKNTYGEKGFKIINGYNSNNFLNYLNVIKNDSINYERSDFGAIYSVIRLNEYKTRKYNNEDYIGKIKVFNKNKKLIREESFNYNSLSKKLKGEIHKYPQYSTTKNHYRYNIKYDDKENIISYMTQRIPPKWEIKTLKTQRKFPKKNVEINNLTYDKYGNWIKKIVFYNGKVEKIEERKFTYIY